MLETLNCEIQFPPNQNQIPVCPASVADYSFELYEVRSRYAHDFNFEIEFGYLEEIREENFIFQAGDGG